MRRQHLQGIRIWCCRMRRCWNHPIIFTVYWVCSLCNKHVLCWVSPSDSLNQPLLPLKYSLWRKQQKYSSANQPVDHKWCMQTCAVCKADCVWHGVMTLIHPRCLGALFKAADCLVPKDNMLSYCAVPLRDAHPGHTLLHSVLSSVSLPHYSSSNFKREYALLQLVCLESNLSRSSQWTALIWPLFVSHSFIFPFVCVFRSLLCLLRLIWHLKIWRVEDRRRHFAYIFGQSDRGGNSGLKYWKTFRRCGIQT